MLKRFLCIVLCLLFVIPAVIAETADTLPKRFARQLCGGNGARGYISVTASGVAEWLNMLMPFTATDIQMRAIAQKQGDMSASITDDDEWQIKFYAKDQDGKEAGVSWLYGDPYGMYFKSELLPDILLKVPVERVHLLYQLFKGELNDMFFAFDPLKMKEPGVNGNAAAYQAVANILGIDGEAWKTEWLPVLEKYFQHLELWLAGYGEASIVSENPGKLTMSASYTIPAKELKAEAKYVIGQMMYDNDLQELLIPHVTMEQRITYLNPQMVYFYEACIDALALEGDITFSREMSALGEVVSSTVSLPLPVLPEKVTAPVNEVMLKLLKLPYSDLLDGADRLTIDQKGAERKVTIHGSKRTFVMNGVQNAVDNGAEMTGTIEILPTAGSNEQAVSAAFSVSRTHRIWQDEKYIDHDTAEMKLSVKPVSEEDQSFDPAAFAVTVDYRNNPNQQDSPVQVNLNVEADLPDAQVALEAVMRITTQLTMQKMSAEGAKDTSVMTKEEKAQLLQDFVQNAAGVMTALYEAPAEAATVDSAAANAVVPSADE